MPLSNAAVINDLDLETNSVTWAETSSVLALLFAFTRGGETYQPHYRTEIHWVPGRAGDLLRAEETHKPTSACTRPPVRGVCV